jgi:hypothetical protein
MLLLENRQAGPCSGGCWGNCGIGCFGIGLQRIFSRDCMDHDVCCYIHGGCTSPTNIDCHDEYSEAQDDVFYGRSNCDFMRGPNCWK